MSDRGDGNIERPSSSPQLFFFFSQGQGAKFIYFPESYDEILLSTLW